MRTPLALGPIAGPVDLVQRVATGIPVRGEVPHLAPDLPQGMERLDMRIRHRGHSLDLRLRRGSLTLRASDGAAAPITLCVDGEVCAFSSATAASFD
jgi:trehalose/maltose hydrolase-like predicted phosphorylase